MKTRQKLITISFSAAAILLAVIAIKVNAHHQLAISFVLAILGLAAWPGK